MLSDRESKIYRTGVITLSDKGAKGERTDESGPLICKMLEERGKGECDSKGKDKSNGECSGKYQIVCQLILGDDRPAIEETLRRLCDEEKLDLILTTGGTGFSARDVTPEATMAVAERNAPGISEYMRARSFAITPKAMLSRGVSVIRGKTLIINLPGSPRAVAENLDFILPALSHGLDILLGRDDECGGTSVK